MDIRMTKQDWDKVEDVVTEVYESDDFDGDEFDDVMYAVEQALIALDIDTSSCFYDDDDDEEDEDEDEDEDFNLAEACPGLGDLVFDYHGHHAISSKVAESLLNLLSEFIANEFPDMTPPEQANMVGELFTQFTDAFDVTHVISEDDEDD